MQDLDEDLPLIGADRFLFQLHIVQPLSLVDPIFLTTISYVIGLWSMERRHLVLRNLLRNPPDSASI